MLDLGDTKLDHDYIRRMPLNKAVPVASHKGGGGSVDDVGSFVAGLLVRVSNSCWELLNEFDDDMLPLEWEGDHGLNNIFGIYIKQPDEAFCEYYETNLTPPPMEVHTVSPKRDSLRKRAAEKMQKAADAMQKTARKSYGEDKPFDVGVVVHVPLKDVDRAKVDSGNLMGVIVKVDKSRSMARVAVKSGILKAWYVYHKLSIVKGVGNDASLCGLSDALAGWEKLKVVTEREAARNESLVGGQGKGQMICNCKGECKSNHCSCFKSKRICGSSCHRNNFNCANHDSHGEDLFLPKNTRELGQDLLLPENSSD